ncbi:MAG: hypothetical protein ACREV9_09700 [Burkholderiales bacterium]
MTELYAILMSWAITLSGYSVPANQPEIVMAPHSYLVDAACAGRECKVLGWFPPGETIYLDNRLDPMESVYASSILVHELVHFLQQQSGRFEAKYSCETALAMEREAYGVQREFLLRYGVYQPVGASMHAVGCEPVARRDTLAKAEGTISASAGGHP